MKKSLGRRSSSRNAPMGSVRNSGIPVRRAASTDRNLAILATPLNRNLVTPKTRRTASEDRNSMITHSVRSQGFGGGTERPSRATTLSTNSVRHSSYGGARSKKDNRPIEDKDWQISAQKRIEQYLIQDPEGCHMLVNNCSLRPITGKMFISIVDLLLRRLDGSVNKSYINKENYIAELPFIMKKLLYRGKIEKSWLITVNTSRSWSHVLACIDFLVSCVTSQIVIDPLAVMFPEQYDKNPDDFWDYKVLLPYFQKSFELFKNNIPNYEEVQEQLDREVIEIHVSNDNVFDRITTVQCDIKRTKQESELMKEQLEKVKQALQELNEIYNNLKDERSQYDDYIIGYNKFMEESKNNLVNMERHIKALSDQLEETKRKKVEMERVVSNQQLSQHQLAELRKKRDSLQREIKREQEYIAVYEELVHNNSLETLSLKKNIDDLIKKYNIEVIKYLPCEFENSLEPNQDEEEILKRLDGVQKAINSAKCGLQALSESNSLEVVNQMQVELDALSKQISEKKNKMKYVLDKHISTVKEKEDHIRKMKKEVENLSEKLNFLCSNDPETESTLEDKKKQADKMERQLTVLKNNAVLYTTECKKILEEYNEKHKALDEEFKRM